MIDQTFPAAVASTLLPGGTLANGIEAPCAGQLLDQAALSDWLAREEFAPAVTAILGETGDARAFIEAAPEHRVVALQVAEAKQRGAFTELVAALLKLYYEHPTVLEAFGWRSAPPQPEGHDLEAVDASLFERVAARGPIWRGTK